MIQALPTNVWQLLIKLYMHLPYKLEILLLVISPKEMNGYLDPEKELDF